MPHRALSSSPSEVEMSDANIESPSQPAASHRFRLPTLLVVCGFLFITAFLLLKEHRVHMLGILPYLLLLACPLLHLFHGGHGGHGAHDGPARSPEAGAEPVPHHHGRGGGA